MAKISETTKFTASICERKKNMARTPNHAIMNMCMRIFTLLPCIIAAFACTLTTRKYKLKLRTQIHSHILTWAKLIQKANIRWKMNKHYCVWVGKRESFFCSFLFSFLYVIFCCFYLFFSSLRILQLYACHSSDKRHLFTNKSLFMFFCHFGYNTNAMANIHIRMMCKIHQTEFNAMCIYWRCIQCYANVT